MDVAVPKDSIEKVYSGVDEEILLLHDAQSFTNTQVPSDKTVVETLDACLRRLFAYIHKECHNPDSETLDWEKTKGNVFITKKILFILMKR